jgi:hypothetical protein
MAHHGRRGRRGPETARRALRREAPSTVAVVADPAGFAAMRRYTTFAFDDHRRYLRQTEGLLRSLTAQGVHTRVGLFEPDDYAHFCAQERIDPDTPDSRARYVAEIAATGATGPLAAVLRIERTPRGGTEPATAEESAFRTVLASGLATGRPGGVVMRTIRDGNEEVRGWSLKGGRLRPLTEAEVFSAYCTDSRTGDPVPPEPGLTYRAGFPLPEHTAEERRHGRRKEDR